MSPLTLTAALTLVIAVLSLTTLHARADAPYVRERCETRLPDGRAVYVVLHYGDGVMWTDPVEPLVVDDAGHVLATGRTTFLYYLFCARRIADVVLYAPEEHLALTVDPAAIASAHGPVRDLAQAYPGEFVIGGFVERLAANREALWLQLRAAPFYWPSFLWYAALWLLVVLPFRLPQGPRVRDRVWPLIAGVTRMLAFAGAMSLSAFVALVVDPASAVIFAILLVLSFALAMSIRLVLFRFRKTGRGKS